MHEPKYEDQTPSGEQRRISGICAITASTVSFAPGAAAALALSRRRFKDNENLSGRDMVNE